MCVQIDFQVFGMFHANRARILHQDQHYLQTDLTEHPLEPLHLGVPTSASKMDSQTTVHSVQTVHLSCTETNTISKETEVRFYMTHVIQEFYWVLPNIFLSIWYVRCNSCTYLALRLALSPNRLNRASIRSTNKCIQNGFLDYGAFGANCALILHRN